MRRIDLSIVVMMLLFTSCASNYIPSLPNTPLLTSKGEKQVELAVSTNSVHISSAYAYNEDYAVMLQAGSSFYNYSDYYDYGTHKSETSQGWLDLTPYGEFAHNNVELGIGRYNILKSKFKMEVFGGLGYGFAYDDYAGEDYRSDYANSFLQFNLGQAHRIFDFGGSVRVMGSFHDYNYYGENSEHINLKMKALHVIPSGFAKIGSEKLRIVARFGFNLPVLYSGFKTGDGEVGGRSATSTFMHLSLGAQYKF